MMIILIYVYLISGAHLKASAVFLYVVGFSFLIVDGVYLMWSLLANNFELIGLLTIGLSGLMCVMFAFYFGRVLKSSGPALLPEDRLDADIDDGDPELGHFSPWSWWPILFAGAISIAMLGLAVSAWIMVIAIPMLVVTIIGWTFEYYRGYFAR